MIECNDGPNRMIDRNYKSQFKLITCGSNTSASKRPYKRHEYVINQWKECQERRLSEHFIPIPDCVRQSAIMTCDAHSNGARSHPTISRDLSYI
ncbi:hypothetical protein BLOT_007775 [Blomia tropicalis]|nr:hypothetical protein BLOT_007775 [Blomia tropicalis]